MSFAFLTPYRGVIVGGVLAAAVAGVFRGNEALWAAAYGASIVLVTQLIQIFHLRRSERRHVNEAGKVFAAAIACEVERYAAVIVMIWIGLQHLALEPLSLISAFAFTFLVSVLTSFEIRSRVKQHGKQ